MTMWGALFPREGFNPNTLTRRQNRAIAGFMYGHDITAEQYAIVRDLMAAGIIEFKLRTSALIEGGYG